MELVYIWIEKFAGFKKQGFNFSSRWNLEFSLEKNTLSIKENKNYCHDFFGKNIANLTAIIGQNGSGKSTLLNLLNPSNSEHYLSAEYGNFTVVFFENDIFYIMYNPNYHRYIEEIKITPVELENFHEKYSIRDISKERKNKSFERIVKTTLNLSVIYYNFQLEERMPFWGRELIDLSTKGTIKKIEEEIFKKNEDEILREDKTLFLMDRYYLQEIKQKITLIKKQKAIQSGIANFIPSSISVYYNMEYYCYNTLEIIEKYIKKQLNKNGTEKQELYEHITPFFLKELENRKTSKDWLRHSFFIELFKNILYNLIHENWDKSLDFCKLVDEWSTTPSISFENLISNMTKWRDRELKMKCESFDNDRLRSLQQLESQINFDQSSSDDYLSYARSLKNLSIFDFPIQNNYKVDFFEYISMFEILPFFFHWKNDSYSNRRDKYLLSYGEDALLTIFSRLYSIKEETKEIKNILICLDEPDIGLHPEWQRSLISKLVQYLPTIFCTDEDETLNDKKIQIVLTTHSPFLASDLPKSNIIFLEKKEQSSQVVEGLYQKETFGSNIHTLFTDSFFMNGGLMGEFAKNKIDKLIKFLTSGKPNEVIQTIEDASNLINIIGEPILKRQLQKMLDSKRLEKVDTIDKKVDTIDILKDTIESLEKRVTYLENNKGND